jgi:peptide-methionine (S)-S-oxide reductase
MHNWLLISMLLFSCADVKGDLEHKSKQNSMQGSKTMETATFGAGCFWCVEAMFESLKGVDSAVSGYSGGHVKRPTYKEVCNGTTGHAEVIQVHFDPSVITYEELLEAFFLSARPYHP